MFEFNKLSIINLLINIRNFNPFFQKFWLQFYLVYFILISSPLVCAFEAICLIF